MMPSALRYARILVAFELTRLVGLILFSGIQRGLLPSRAELYGVGDVLVALTAVPVWYALGKGRMRAYGLAMAWVSFGLVDLLYAISDSTLSGQLGAINTLFGPGIVIVPVQVVVQVVTLALLLSRSVSGYMARP